MTQANTPPKNPARFNRYNAEGLAGLSNRLPAGPSSRLTAGQQAEIATWVRAGPDLAEDGVVRWLSAEPCSA